jgi:uncharacterized membrane protein
MLVTVPIGLWLFSFVCDLLFAVSGDAAWAFVAFYALAGGALGALAAAVPGFVDFLALRARRARRIAALHMGLNLALVLLVGLNLWLRWTTDDAAWPIGLSTLMVVMLGVSGWFGGELVHVLGVTVDPDATASRRQLAAEAGIAAAPRPGDPAPPAR